MLFARPAASRPATGPLSAQVGNDIFLEGTFVSIGISGSGSFGTQNAVPDGFARGPLQLGYIFDDDGFGIGADALTGDFFLPGAPEEGFTVGYRTTAGDDGTSNTFTNVERESEIEINRTSVTNLSSGDRLAARFVGVTSDGVLQVTQDVSYAVGSKQIGIVITLSNLGSREVFDVRYLRNVDPDQDFDTGGDFTTSNSVLSNFPTDGRAVVQAVGLRSGVPFLYVATDPRLRASYGGFDNRDPYEASLYDAPQATGSTVVDDIAVTMTADVGSIAPGASKSFQFFLGFEEAIATDPLLTLTASPLSIVEGATSTLTAALSEASDEEVVVTLGYSGTADSGTDYTAAATITIPVGSTSATIPLASLADATVEGGETAIAEIVSATNAVEQGEQSVTVTITDAPIVPVACTPAAPIFFSGWDVDETKGPRDPRGEYAEISNDGSTGVDLSGCTFIVFNPFTEFVIYAANARSVLAAGSAYSFANTVVGNGQAVPRRTFPNGPSAFALVSGRALAGQSVSTVLANTPVVAAVVLGRNGALFGSARGGRSASRASRALGLPEILAQLRSTASEDEAGAVDLSVSAVPNPVSENGRVSFGIAEPGDATVALYDALGRQVALLAEGFFYSGRHSVVLTAAELPAGLYVVRVSSAASVQTSRITIVR